MNLIHELLPPRSQIEVVELKGAGHPDTLADALAEGFSVALSRYYLEHFDRILHHNVDKALIVGGASLPRYGGGALTAPIEVTLAGRVTAEVRGVKIPIADLAQAVLERVLSERLRFLRPADVRLRVCVRPGSADLREVFATADRANDTSIGVGFAPASKLERRVLAVDTTLHAARRSQPWLGEDTKVMGVRVGDLMELTAAVAFVDRFLTNEADYLAKKAQLETGGFVVNAADTPGHPYLTVTGSSVEAGDDGQVGRGNRVGGLITPMRPMTLEAAAGKNPVTHVGKLYSVVARRAAERLVAEGAGQAEVVLVSRIGQPISEPWLAAVRTLEPMPPKLIEAGLRELLGNLPRVTEAILEGAVTLF